MSSPDADRFRGAGGTEGDRRVRPRSVPVRPGPSRCSREREVQSPPPAADPDHSRTGGVERWGGGWGCPSPSPRRARDTSCPSVPRLAGRPRASPRLVRLVRRTDYVYSRPVVSCGDIACYLFILQGLAQYCRAYPPSQHNRHYRTQPFSPAKVGDLCPAKGYAAEYAPVSRDRAPDR
jgi:hypothetical protein